MTMLPRESLTDAEFEELDGLLMSDVMPENGMDSSTLDGFLAAVLLNPALILPSKWLPWVWDMKDAQASPDFADLKAAERAMALIMGHYNDVARAIEAGDFEPVLYELAQPDGSEFFDAEGWADGFMLGVTRFVDPWWRPVLDEHVELVAPMLLLGTERGWKALEQSGDNRAATRAAYEAIPNAVAALSEHFRPMREQADRERLAPVRRAAAKVGRNDPCPCGSGKKYKKCCGSGGLPVHH
jgi:uncharacterized protein